ncbi:uncharacterized protein LOC143854869 [Tasmannia lanceolata]|uniref:uncharacterized protein LOC143854869 n=1 Tax=Tasmannia lanceolata TaxID=3420 RepID=UPI004063193A
MEFEKSEGQCLEIEKSEGGCLGIEKSESGYFLSTETGPWLVFPSKETQTFFSISKGRYDVKKISEMYGDYHVWRSSHGWLVIEDYSDQEFLLLLEPISMETIKIPIQPPLPDEDWFECFLPLPPTDPNYVIVFTCLKNPYFHYFRAGDDIWTMYEYDVGQGCIIYYLVSCNGKLYAYTSGNKVAVVEIFPRHRVTLLEIETVSQIPTEHVAYTYLLESRGEVFLIFKHCYSYTTTLYSLMVFRMDLSKMVWVKVESIGDDRIFFLGYCGHCDSYTITQPRGVKGDVVYFFHYYKDEDEAVYQFDFEKGSLSIDLPCNNKVSNAICGSPFWLLPAVSFGDVSQYLQRTSSNYCLRYCAKS